MFLSISASHFFSEIYIYIYKPLRLWSKILFIYIYSLNQRVGITQNLYCAGPFAVFRQAMSVMGEEGWWERPQLGARALLQMRAGQGADSEGEWVMCSLDTSPLGQLGLHVSPPLADSDRNSSPALAWTLFSVAWNGLHLQRCQEQVKNHQAKYQPWLLFFQGHHADCQFSLRSDLLASFVLLCYTLPAEQCVNVIGMESLHSNSLAVK